MSRLALLAVVVAALLGALFWFGLRPEVERGEEVLAPVGRAVESAEPEELERPAANRPSAPVGTRASEGPSTEDDRTPITHTPPDLFTGVVTDEGGRALRGVRVVRGGPGDVRSFRENEPIVRGRGLSEFSTLTDGQGRFRFSLGSEFGAELLIRDFWLEGYLPAEHHSIIERGRVARLRMARREEARLSIRATDATTGLPVPEFELSVFYTTGGEVWSHLSHTEEGSDGECRVPLNFPRGCDSVEVLGWALGMTDSDFDDPSGLHRASFRPLAGSAHQVHLVLLLDRPEREAEALVSGIVYSTISDEVLAGAEIHHQDRKVLTGSDGRFRIATVGGGALWAAAEGHDHRRADVSPGEELVLRLPAPAVIFGRVIDGSGSGLAGIKLKMEEGDRRVPTRSRGRLRTQTDEAGEFSIELRSGTHAMMWDPDLPGEEDRILLLELAPGERRELLLERDSLTFAILEGRVMAEGTDDVLVAFIEIGGNGSVSLSERKGGGEYRSGPLSPGHYAVILVEDRGPDRGILLAPIEVPEPGVHHVDFSPSVVPLRGRIEGLPDGGTDVVFVPHGAGGKRMEVLLGGMNVAEVIGVEPEEDGSFVLSAVLAGAGELQLYGEEGLLGRRSVDPRREPDIGVWTLR